MSTSAAVDNGTAKPDVFEITASIETRQWRDACVYLLKEIGGRPQHLGAHYTEVGMLRAVPYRLYLKTKHWANVAARAKKRAGHRCQICAAHKGPLEAHHNTYERLGEEHDADVIVLCAGCHSRHHDALPKAA